MSGWSGPTYDMTAGAPPAGGGAGFPPPYGASPPMPDATPSAVPMSGHLGGAQAAPPGMGSPAPAPPGGFAPIAGLPLDANVAAQFGMAYGAQALNAGQQYLHSNVDRFVNVGQLKRYFAVSNEYVARKLGIILFPFRHRNWERSMDGTWKPPREDLNAPDLYIPVMAFITYMLLVGVALGQRHAFTPEVLGMVASKATAVLVVEILVIKAACLSLSVSSDRVNFLDLIAFMSYKFVAPTTYAGAASMIVDVLADVLLGSMFYWLSFFYTGFALGVFLMRSLGRSFRGDPVAGDGEPARNPRYRRNLLLLAIAGTQFVTTYYLTHY